VVRDELPVQITGTGLIDVHLYRQTGRLVLHLVNLTNAGTWRQPIDELIPIGPVSIRVRLPDGIKARVRSLVTSAPLAIREHGDWAELELATILDHEVLVIG
jgi:hypothetical protein